MGISWLGKCCGDETSSQQLLTEQARLRKHCAALATELEKAHKYGAEQREEKRKVAKELTVSKNNLRSSELEVRELSISLQTSTYTNAELRLEIARLRTELQNRQTAEAVQETIDRNGEQLKQLDLQAQLNKLRVDYDNLEQENLQLKDTINAKPAQAAS